MIADYANVTPKGDLVLLQKLGEKLNNRSFLHVNSTRSGGGVAEILHRMLPILKEVGIDAKWEVIRGDDRFFEITKKIHNALQGNTEQIGHDMLEYHFEVNRLNAAELNLEADAVLMHSGTTISITLFTP